MKSSYICRILDPTIAGMQRHGRRIRVGMDRPCCERHTPALSDVIHDKFIYSAVRTPMQEWFWKKSKKENWWKDKIRENQWFIEKALPDRRCRGCAVDIPPYHCCWCGMQTWLLKEGLDKVCQLYFLHTYPNGKEKLSSIEALLHYSGYLSSQMESTKETDLGV